MRVPIVASYLMLVLFFLLSALQKNMEFLIYAAVLVPVVALLHLTDRVFRYKALALWGFAVWMLLHLVGGLVSFRDMRMYDYMLLPIVGEPYNILKYDQLVHFYCYVIFALLLSSVVLHVAKRRASAFTLSIIILFAAIGIGAMNEIFEFVPVVLFASPGPGGYTNTAIDLVANFLGALVGTVLSWKV